MDSLGRSDDDLHIATIGTDFYFRIVVRQPKHLYEASRLGPLVQAAATCPEFQNRHGVQNNHAGMGMRFRSISIGREKEENRDGQGSWKVPKHNRMTQITRSVWPARFSAQARGDTGPAGKIPFDPSMTSIKAGNYIGGEWHAARQEYESVNFMNLPSIGAEAYRPFGGVRAGDNGHPGAEAILDSVSHLVAFTVNQGREIVMAQGLSTDI